MRDLFFLASLGFFGFFGGGRVSGWTFAFGAMAGGAAGVASGSTAALGFFSFFSAMFPFDILTHGTRNVQHAAACFNGCVSVRCLRRSEAEIYDRDGYGRCRRSQQCRRAALAR